MRKINILTKSIYNKIAAGEVVDRPYSVVKELVENSLDAGATEIEIYIEKGGKQLIKIIDNGCGIERDDLRAAFFPHATSKIATADDLANITTMGFRGEALASISAVSKVELTSVTKGNPAYKIKCEDGKTGEILPAALACGTEICVRNLFYNTPAREKFLKPDKKEETDITSFVTRYILGNPNIAFRYYVDDKLILQSFGGGIDEAVARVYGAKVLSECFKIKADYNGVKISGFIGNQNFFKSNKSYQSLFLNGRYIVNNTIATAMTTAYSGYAMKRQYPFYILFVDIPSDIVDVNVHPNKADVRFVDNKMIFSAVYHVVSSVLDGSAKALDYVVTETRIPEIKSTSGGDKGINKVYSQASLVSEKDESSIISANSDERDKKENSQMDKKSDAIEDIQNIKPEDFANLIEKYKPEVRVEKRAVEDKPHIVADIPSQINGGVKKKYFDPLRDLTINEFMPSQKPSVMSVTDTSMPPSLNNGAEYEIENYFKVKQERIEYQSCKYKGNLFNTYLIYEQCDTVYLIDQHAAHERLIYDKLREKLEKRKIVSQAILYPYILDTNPIESRFIQEKLPLLRNMGFGIAPFGIDSYRIDEVPVDLQEMNVKEFFDDILSCIDSYKEIKLEDILKDKIAMTACKHAVKGGMELTDEEISALFKMINGNIGLKCPHGRPICVTLTKHDIEKIFKRIV